MRRNVPPSYEEEMKWRGLLVRVATISALTTMVFSFVSVLYLFPDSSLPTYFEPPKNIDPFTKFMSNLLFGSIPFVLLFLLIAPVAIIGGSIFLFEGLKFGIKLLITGLALQSFTGVLLLGNPFMPAFVTLPIIITSGAMLAMALKARTYL